MSLDRPIIVGILNVTPDSFSDGGHYTTVAAAVARAETLAAEGATILDVGGESTRPGALPVSEAEELERVLPVVEALARRLPSLLVSVDTVKSGVAERCLDHGAAIVNDVSGLRLDAAMAGLCAARNAGVIAMHSRGGVAQMASLDQAHYPGGVVAEVAGELGAALGRARSGGLQDERLVIDPGFGFGKTPEQNVELLRGLGALRVLGRPIMVGPSRKRFLGALTGRAVEERDQATAAACAFAWAAGASLFRVHDAAPTRDALAVAAAVNPR
ncbi:MAG: dihydropteroate synthase [Gemmatimonadales bacterium]|nr:dihydropteroate synthase [Gemmatimonadales bacterium]